MKKKVLLVIIVAVLVGVGVYAGVYLATRPSGPAVELALKASDLGLGWKAGSFYSLYEGRTISQQFGKTIQVEDNIQLRMAVYQTIAVYPSTETAIEDTNLGAARDRSPDPMNMPFWDEAYGSSPLPVDTAIVLRKSNIVVLLYYEHLLILTDPLLEMVGIPPEKEAEIDSQQKEIMWNFLCDLAQVIQGKIIETSGG